MHLFFETSMSIIKTGSSVLLELIDLGNYYDFSQTTLHRWLTSLVRSVAVTQTVLLSFMIYVFLLTLVFGFLVAFLLLRNSNHVVFSVSIDFPSNSKKDALFHLMTILVHIEMVKII